MSVLVTGAAGFVGGYLLEHLRERGYAPLYGLARRATPEQRASTGVEWLAADLCDVEATRRAVAAARPDAVYHLAGEASAAGGAREPIFCANVEGTLSLLAALREQGRPARVMLASTGYVYGACELGRPATEETPLSPKGAYAESKAEMERRALAEDWGAAVVVVVARAFNHTGPRQQPAFAVPAFAQQLAAIEAGAAEPVVRVGNLETWRDISDVRDVVRAYTTLLAEGAHGEPFNVCGGRPVQMADVLAALIGMCRVPVQVVPDAERMRPVDLRVNYGSPGKLESRTGWRAEIALGQTLRDMLEWWRRNVRRP